jgi:hypothetical protein
MEKKIKSELFKMSAIMLLLVGLGIYAYEFVYEGVMAKAALNLSIFGIFGLAAWLAFDHVLKLRNEVVALKALQVDFGARSRRLADPYDVPAIIFKEPYLLGEGYRMITEELAKQDTLQISNSTVQILLHDVDERINDRKSTIIYFSGLMVFLGLLGAFMGLMKTVHSVGELIGSMDVSGNAGTDSFGKLIEGMKGPLNGMSVGFSSSLFGLMTSMALGALERFMTSAMKALRNEFEHWLSNVAALESTPTETASAQDSTADYQRVVGVLQMGVEQLRTMNEGVTANARAGEVTYAAISAMANSVGSLSQSVSAATDPRRLLQPIAECVSELSRNQIMMITQVQNLAQMVNDDRIAARNMLDGMKMLAERQAYVDGRQLHDQLNEMIALQAEISARDPVQLWASPDGTVRREPAASSWWGKMKMLISTNRAATSARASATERKRLRREVRNALQLQRKMMRAMERTMSRSVGKIDEAHVRDAQAVARLMAESESNNARLATLMNRLEAVGSPAVPGKPPASDLSGARLEMEMLRQRLDTLQGGPTVQDDVNRRTHGLEDRAGTTPTPRSVAAGN